MSADGHRTKWRRKSSENFNRLSRAHERYRQTDDRQTDGRRHIANMNLSSRSLIKITVNKNNLHTVSKKNKVLQATTVIKPHMLKYNASIMSRKHRNVDYGKTTTISAVTVNVVTSCRSCSEVLN